MEITSEVHKPKAENPLLRFILDIGPLLLFFLANSVGESRFGLDETERVIVATSVFVVATLISLGIGYIFTRKVSGMALFSGILVLFFGGLTIYLKDKTFFQLKFTLVNVFFGVLILGGLIFKKSLLAMVLNSGFKLTEEGWYKLSVRWGVFFLFLGAANEVLRRMVDWNTWTNLKFFALMPLMFIFAVAQAPLMMRYELKEPLSEEGNNTQG